MFRFFYLFWTQTETYGSSIMLQLPPQLLTLTVNGEEREFIVLIRIYIDYC